MKVTQKDRDDAADLWLALSSEATADEISVADAIRRGEQDFVPAVKWMAGHNATTRAELAASKERERETLAVLQTAHESEAALVAERDRLREALAETREMLGLCEQIICDETCPTTWRTADGQPHGQMHKDICDVLARHEHHIYPARAALSEQQP